METETYNLMIRYKLALKAIEDAVNNGCDKRALLIRVREIEFDQRCTDAPDGCPEIESISGNRVVVR